MVGLGGWLRGPSKPASIAPPKSPVDEEKQLEHALAAVIWIMSDDVDKADSALHEENSSFHLLGRGLTQFMRSVMGFEQDVMKEASDRLAAAEASSWADMKRAQKEPTIYESRLYSPGAEYALCHAESQLMSSVVALLNESLTESIRGFYKLRKAYVTLDGIMQEEAAYMAKQRGAPTPTERPRPRRQSMPGSFDETEFLESMSDLNTSEMDLEAKNANSPQKRTPEDSDLEFVDATETPTGMETPSNYLGHTISKQDFEAQMKNLIIEENEKEEERGGESSRTTIISAKSKDSSDQGPEVDFFANPVDLFIHSGANLCFGLLQLILSMVPPAFSKLLSIIGFKGDRELGIKLLWQATKFNNIKGAAAGLVLLGYYNGLLGFCDIVLTDNDVGENGNSALPKAKCDELIATMKARYPESRLWRLEEARKEAGDGNLRAAIEILNSNQDSKMKQVLALNMFERSLCSMALHEYALCSESFVACTKLNSWSHSLYIFGAGSAQVELYRRYRVSNPEFAKKYKDKATQLLRQAPTLAGKKRFMAKQLPFDVYVCRKVQKWEERAKEWKIDLVDAIGVSPIEEMTYLWNGYKKMRSADLEISLHNLEWSHATHPEKFKADIDEIGVRSLLRATVLRNIGKYDEARQLLMDDLISHDRYVLHS